MGTNLPDYDDGFIQTARDLEDFTRLHIHFGALESEIANGTIKVGLKWVDSGETDPKIRVYKSTDPAGSDSYLKQDTAALAQITGNDADMIGEVAEGEPLILDQPGLWSGFSQANPTLCLLFEGSGEGKGCLSLTLHTANGTLVGEGPGVWIELLNVKKMYQSSVANEFEQPTGEAPQTVIFVHGWNMSPEGSRIDAETMFKRLWHRGFKGRFAYFRWNTYAAKLPDGRYARLSFRMIAGGNHYFILESFLNPTPGDRNLEYDPKKTTP